MVFCFCFCFLFCFVFLNTSPGHIRPRDQNFLNYFTTASGKPSWRKTLFMNSRNFPPPPSLERWGIVHKSKPTTDWREWGHYHTYLWNTPLLRGEGGGGEGGRKRARQRHYCASKLSDLPGQPCLSNGPGDTIWVLWGFNSLPCTYPTPCPRNARHIGSQFSLPVSVVPHPTLAGARAQATHHQHLIPTATSSQTSPPRASFPTPDISSLRSSSHPQSKPRIPSSLPGPPFLTQKMKV